MNPPGQKTAAYSCEENCPTGALVRVNPREYFDEVNETIGLIQRSKTHAIGENIHKFDLWATIWHVIGVVVVVVLLAALPFGQHARFRRTFLLAPAHG